MSEVAAYFVGVIILVAVLYYGLQLLGSLLIFNPILGVILLGIVVGFIGLLVLKINFNYFKWGLLLMEYRGEYQTKKAIIYFIEDHYEEGAFFYIKYIMDKIVITKIKPFEFIEQDVIEYNYGDEKVIGVIDNVSLSHYINTMMYFHNQIGSTQHNFPDLWRVMKFGRITHENIEWCVENDKLYGVKIERVTPK